MSYTRSSVFGSSVQNEIKRSNDLIFHIVTNNFNKIKELVNKQNVNKIIDESNKYTALHYSLQVPDPKITNYLLELGANPLIKNSSEQTSYDLALVLNRKCIYQFDIKNLNKKIQDLEYINRDIEQKSQQKSESILYLSKSIDNFREQIKKLEKEIILMESDNHQLKEMNTRLKRKNEELNDSIDGLIKTKKR